MIYHSTQSNDYLRYFILRGKKTHPNTKFLPIFNKMVRTKKLFKGIIGYEVVCNISTAEPTKYSFTKKDIEAKERSC